MLHILLEVSPAINPNPDTSKMVSLFFHKSPINDDIYRLATLNEKKVDVKFDYAMNLQAKMDGILVTASLMEKINILGSIFPEKLEYNGKNYRTDSYNEVLEVIFKDVSKLYEIKEEPDKNSTSSSLVPLMVLFSEPFLHDLELIWKLNKTLKTNLH